jgi:hypothetical protein
MTGRNRKPTKYERIADSSGEGYLQRPSRRARLMLWIGAGACAIFGLVVAPSIYTSLHLRHTTLGLIVSGVGKTAIPVALVLGSLASSGIPRLGPEARARMHARLPFYILGSIIFVGLVALAWISAANS